jgi:proline racemase
MSEAEKLLRIATIDAHVGGASVRLITSGYPAPRGKTMHDKQVWASRHADLVRRAIVREPRGHRGLIGVVLTEGTSPDADAGLLFLHGDGYSPLCGHGIIGAITIALERHLLEPRDARGVRIDTAAGPVAVEADIRTEPPMRVERVRYIGPPVFVYAAGVPLTIGARSVRVDLAFAGECYAIVDAESAGVPLDGDYDPELRRAGLALVAAANAAVQPVHPQNAALAGIAAAVFIGPADREGADLRSAAVYADGSVDRSPSGGGTAAVMAVLDAMGLITPPAVFTHESLIGTRFTGRIAGREVVGDRPAIVVEIEASAWITGEHTFLIDPSDPLREGFEWQA